jgi:Uma2 family endonuclease
MASVTRLTIDDFERLPAEEAKNHELIDGKLIPVSGNTPKHNLVFGLLFTQLWLFIRERQIGTVLAEQVS